MSDVSKSTESLEDSVKSGRGKWRGPTQTGETSQGNLNDSSKPRIPDSQQRILGKIDTKEGDTKGGDAKGSSPIISGDSTGKQDALPHDLMSRWLSGRNYTEISYQDFGSVDQGGRRERVELPVVAAPSWTELPQVWTESLQKWIDRCRGKRKTTPLSERTALAPGEATTSREEGDRLPQGPIYGTFMSDSEVSNGGEGPSRDIQPEVGKDATSISPQTQEQETLWNEFCNKNPRTFMEWISPWKAPVAERKIYKNAAEEIGLPMMTFMALTKARGVESSVNMYEMKQILKNTENLKEAIKKIYAQHAEAQHAEAQHAENEENKKLSYGEYLSSKIQELSSKIQESSKGKGKGKSTEKLISDVPIQKRRAILHQITHFIVLAELLKNEQFKDRHKEIIGAMALTAEHIVSEHRKSNQAILSSYFTYFTAKMDQIRSGIWGDELIPTPIRRSNSRWHRRW